jgi:hypothetical protein
VEEVIMSLLYSVLKLIVRKKVKENKHPEETYEDFARTSHEIQAKFKLKLPKKDGYEFKIREIDGFQVVIGHKTGTDAKRALLYLVGGGMRRWQMPSEKSMLRYIEETNRDLSGYSINFPHFSRLPEPFHSEMICIFPCFCPYGQVTREIFCCHASVGNCRGQVPQVNVF